jgi:uncharacterized protein YndB with AHSA1/START domain
MRAQATRTVDAPPPEVWRVVADPDHLARWWPGVERVEGVGDERFTLVQRSSRGRPVRADHRIVLREEPRRVAWEQLLAGTPFERLLESGRTEVRLRPAGAGTRVELELEQRLRGWSRLAPFLFARAGRATLTAALDGLEAVAARR